MNVLTDNTEVAGKNMGGEWYGNMYDVLKEDNQQTIGLWLKNKHF